jgi:tetratricopeptide (TPR) repeat protein
MPSPIDDASAHAATHLGLDDPLFAAVVDELRGFDRGDDTDLLAKLDEQRGELDGDEAVRHAVLLIRAGRLPEALAALNGSATPADREAVVAYLSAQLLAGMGRLAEALDVLDQPALAGAGVPEADRAHARGSVLRALGRTEEALAAYRAGLELDPGDARHWLHTGRLLVELDRHDEAVEALERAVHLDQILAEAHAELAAEYARAGRADAAAHALELLTATAIDPALLARTAADPRFEPVAEHPEVAALLAGIAEAAAGPLTEPGDPGWLDSLAPWLEGLRTDPAAAGLGLRWLGEAESAVLADHVRADGDEHHPLLGSPALAEIRHLLEHLTPVAVGPAVPTRSGSDPEVVWFVDRHDPVQLHLALSDAYPPFLWVPAGTTAGAMAAALGPVTARPSPTVVEMPAGYRTFLGYEEDFSILNVYSGEPEPATTDGLARLFTMSPFLELHSWGSACVDDPWPETIPAQPTFGLKVLREQVKANAQAPGRPPSETWRTVHSRSYLTLEQHGQILVLAARYRPGHHGQVVERVNAAFGCAYPTDLPLDVLAVLGDYPVMDTGALEAALDDQDEPEQTAAILRLLGALWHGDLAALTRLGGYLASPERVVRAQAVNLALDHGLDFLVDRLCLTETDEEILGQIEEIADTRLADGTGTRGRSVVSEHPGGPEPQLLGASTGVAQVIGAAAAAGWAACADLPPATERPRILTWRAGSEPGDEALVSYVEDHVGGCRFLMASGPGAQADLDALAGRLHTEPAEVLLERAADPDPVVAADALNALGALDPGGFGTPQRWAAVFEAALSRPERAVRRAARRSLDSLPRKLGGVSV